MANRSEELKQQQDNIKKQKKSATDLSSFISGLATQRIADELEQRKKANESEFEYRERLRKLEDEKSKKRNQEA